MAPTSRLRRRPLLVFSLAVLLPGLALAALGIGTLRQDRRLLDRQIRERLEAAAGIATAGVARELGQWDRAVADLDTRPPLDAARLPALIREALATPSGAVLIVRDGTGPHVLPADALLYAIPDLTSAPRRADQPPSRAWIEAETLEFQRRDLPQALRAYTALAAAGDAHQRARALAAQARALRKAGRMADARTAYAALGRMTGALVGDLPADLVAIDARCEIDAFASDLGDLASCGLNLSRGLAAGRWPLEKARYVFYAERARTWLSSAGAAAPDRDALARVVAQKATITETAEAVVAAQTGEPGAAQVAHLVVPMADGVAVAWRRAGPDPDLAMWLVLAPSGVAAHVWPRAFGDARDADLCLSLVAPDGSTLYSSDPGAPPPAAESALVAVRDVQDGRALWRVRVWPRDPERLYAGLRVRQVLYAAMLALMVVSLAAGVLLTARTLRRELDVAERESQFVSAVSHEFRSPLAGIRQLSDMLVRQRVPDEQRRQQYYLQIRRESDRLARLVEQVLDVARIKDGRAGYHREPLDTAAWLRDTVADFQQMLDAGDRNVVARIPDTLPPIVADRQAMTTAVHNLLDNAVKYSPGCRSVWLEAEEHCGQVIIRVRDEGVGIPPEEQARVFDCFYRGRQLADEVRGTGLGLSLVSHIVAAHGGRLGVQSTPGKGSTFTIVVPIGGAERPTLVAA